MLPTRTFPFTSDYPSSTSTALLRPVSPCCLSCKSFTLLDVAPSPSLGTIRGATSRPPLLPKRGKRYRARVATVRLVSLDGKVHSLLCFHKTYRTHTGRPLTYSDPLATSHPPWVSSAKFTWIRPWATVRSPLPKRISKQSKATSRHVRPGQGQNSLKTLSTPRSTSAATPVRSLLKKLSTLTSSLLRMPCSSALNLGVSHTTRSNSSTPYRGRSLTPLKGPEAYRKPQEPRCRRHSTA